MPILPLVTIPSPSLRKISAELSRPEILNPTLQKFLQTMIPAMYEYEGIGLAATQVGHNVRACIIGQEAIDRVLRPEKPSKSDSGKSDLILINPEYKKLSKKITRDTEGCLSVPGFYGTVKRYREILVTAYDEKAKKHEFIARDFFARVIQHEIDHLNAILFIDRATDLYQTEHRLKLNPETVLQNIKKPND